MLHPQVVHPAGHIVFYVLFGLLAFIAFVRFFYPYAFRSVFSSFVQTSSFRPADNTAKSGLVVQLFLIFNFFISVTLLALTELVRLHIFSADVYHLPELWGTTMGVVILFYLFNQFFTFLVGFIFNTSNQARQQMKNTALWAYITGIFLTPLLLIYFYTNSILVSDFMVIILAVLILFKWFQTIRIGLTTRNYHLLHLFLYLCAVEIAPLFLLVKMGIR